MVRCKKRHSKEKAKRREFDIIAFYEDKVILNETKSIPRQQYIDAFAEFLFEYFQEYSGRELIPIFAAFTLISKLWNMRHEKVFMCWQ